MSSNTSFIRFVIIKLAVIVQGAFRLTSISLRTMLYIDILRPTNAQKFRRNFGFAPLKTLKFFNLNT